jgi:hypothetical protein
MMLEYIDLFLEDIECGVHALELISEIYKENPKLPLKNLSAIMKKVAYGISEMQFEEQRKSTFLSFLPMFMKYKGEGIREH